MKNKRLLVLTLGALNLIAASAMAEEVQFTQSGHAFTRDRSIPAFGEAWRDESGMVWSNALKRNGKTAHLDRATAIEVCKSIGAELPSQQDYERLSHDLFVERHVVDGEIRGGGVEAQILPNLMGEVFWTSARHPDFPQSTGFVFDFLHQQSIEIGLTFTGGAVRCVARR
jgi:hypothetical protein